MSARYNIKYKDYDTFMADVSDDLAMYDDQGYINPDKYIKIVQKVNSDLSVKINPIKEDAIVIKNKRGILPPDFKLLEEAYICYNYTIEKAVPGMTIEYSEVEEPVESLCPAVSHLCNNHDYACTPYQVWRKYKTESYKIFGVTRLNIYTDLCTSNCASKNSPKNLDQMTITYEDGCYYINTSFEEGLVYVSYVSELVDDDNNLLLLDHPLVAEYYEYEVKTRIYEDLWLNGIEEVATKLKYVKEELRRSKIIAKNFVSTFDFDELKQVYYANRRRMAQKYFSRIM